MQAVAHSVYSYSKFQLCTVCSNMYYTEVSNKFDFFVSAAKGAIKDYIDEYIRVGTAESVKIVSFEKTKNTGLSCIRTITVCNIQEGILMITT